jgi:hypothetical protein
MDKFTPFYRQVITDKLSCKIPDIHNLHNYKVFLQYKDDVNTDCVIQKQKFIFGGIYREWFRCIAPPIISGRWFIGCILDYSINPPVIWIIDNYGDIIEYKEEDTPQWKWIHQNKTDIPFSNLWINTMKDSIERIQKSPMDIHNERILKVPLNIHDEIIKESKRVHEGILLISQQKVMIETYKKEVAELQRNLHLVSYRKLKKCS